MILKEFLQVWHITGVLQLLHIGEMENHQKMQLLQRMEVPHSAALRMDTLSRVSHGLWMECLWKVSANFVV